MRRARTLLVAWREQQLVLMNYRTRISASAEPDAVRVLHFFHGWRTPEDLFACMPEFSRGSLRAGIRQLQENSFLVVKGTADAEHDADLDRVWSDWLPHASFHFATKDTPFLTMRQAARLMERYVAESPRPPLAKSYPHAPHIALPPARGGGGEFVRVLMARQTHRDYSRASISLDAISTLLYYTWGVTGRIDAPPFGQLFHKTSPSGGARHPGEVYLLAMRVAGLSPGLYHYDMVRHRLDYLRSVPAKKKAASYSAGQDFLKDASAVFLMTAVFPRTMWKYRFARAYRVVLLDAGHLCQTFCLVAAWLGLAPFCTAALKDSEIEKDLGIDGIREAALYLAAVGVPVGNSRSRR